MEATYGSGQANRLKEGRLNMRRTVLIAALLLVSASAQAGQSRNLSVAGTASHPIAAPLPPTPANVIAEAPLRVTQSAPAPVAPAPAPPPPPAPPAPVAAAPETGAPPVAAPAAPASAAPATQAPRYVERPAAAPVTTDTKADDGKPSRRAERRHRGRGYWTAGRIMGELQRYGVSYGGYGW
jgi:hypothetical protein